MRTIWKYRVNQIDSEGRAEIQVPPGGEPVSVGVQGKEIVVWCMVNPGYDLVARWERERVFLKFVNTGTHFDETELGEFLGTVTVSHVGVEIVWHVFRLYN